MTRIRNWQKFQHYQTGKNASKRPEWIKLYTGLLDDIEFHRLDGDDAKTLVMLWMLCSETEGELPPVSVVAFRLRLSEKTIISILGRLTHWFEEASYDVPRTEESKRESREEEEIEREGRATARPRGQQGGKHRLPSDWVLTEGHLSSGERLGFSAREIEDMADHFRAHWGSSALPTAQKIDWDKAFHNWMHMQKQKRPNGHSPPGRGRNSTLMNAAAKMMERIRHDTASLNALTDQRAEAGDGIDS